MTVVHCPGDKGVNISNAEADQLEALLLQLVSDLRTMSPFVYDGKREGRFCTLQGARGKVRVLVSVAVHGSHG